ENLLSSLQTSVGAIGDIEQAIDLFVEARVCNGKGGEARTRVLAEQVIRTKEARAGPTDLTLAPSLNNFVDVLVQAGEYRLAREPIERALQIRQATLGPSHPDVADDFDHLARVLALIEKYDEALAASGRALDIKEKSLDPADVRIARTLEIRGSLLQRRGDYAGARRVLDRALTIRELVSPGHAEMAGVLR